MSSNKAPQTIAVSNGIGDDSAFGAVTPPLYLSTNFTFQGFQRARQYDYTRSGNPTRDLLANTIAQLEGGAGALVVSTGRPQLTFPSQVWNRRPHPRPT